MVDFAEFFKCHEDYHFSVGFYGQKMQFTMEDLYQAFKARLAYEQEQESYDRPIGYHKL